MNLRVSAMVEARKRTQKLTHIDWQVVECIEEGLSDKEITKKFGKGDRWASKRIERLFLLLGVSSRAEAVQAAHKLNEDVVLELFDMMNSRNLEGYTDQLSEDFCWESETFRRPRYGPRSMTSSLGAENTQQGRKDLGRRDDPLEERRWYQSARARYEDALKFFKELGEHHLMANTLRALGDLDVRHNNLSEARRHYEQAILTYRAIQDRLGEANTLTALGDLEVLQDNLSKADRYYEEARSISQGIRTEAANSTSDGTDATPLGGLLGRGALKAEQIALNRESVALLAKLFERGVLTKGDLGRNTGWKKAYALAMLAAADLCDVDPTSARITEAGESFILRLVPDAREGAGVTRA